MPALDTWLDQLITRGGTDLHVAVGSAPMARVGSEIVALDEMTLDVGTVDAWLFELIDVGQRDAFDKTGDLLFTYSHRADSHFRAHYAACSGGSRAVFRRRLASVEPEQLGLPDALTAAAARGRGMTLIVGPRGSGKSTTATCLLQAIADDMAVHVMVIDSPVEVPIVGRSAHVTMKEVGIHAPTLGAAIDAATAEDVDVVFVGNLNDGEALKKAMDLTLEGAQVIATMDAAHVVAALEIIATSVPEEDVPALLSALSDGITVLAAQHLIPKADGTGRATAFEILVGTGPVRSALREGRIGMVSALIQAGQSDGMRSLDVELGKLVSEGIVTLDDAVGAATDPESFTAKHGS